jgi:hypothetical protein
MEGRRSHPEMPPIIDDVAEVGVIMTTLSQLVVLSYPSTCVVVG